jgi:hypothetical protein
MVELTVIHPQVDVQESEYVRLLGYPRNHQLEGRPYEIAQWAREWYQQNGKPWVYARKVDQLEVDNKKIRIDGFTLTSARLCQQLAAAGAQDAFLVAVTAGEECEAMARQLWLDEKPDEYFFLEVYGSAVVEHLIASVGFRFCEWADRQHLAVLPHYSPGYPGWDIADQKRLMDLILKARPTALPGRLQVLETGMLSPKKALLAVFGITSHIDRVQHLTGLIPCENCALPSCQYRRVPYRKAPPQIENVGTLRGKENTTSDGKDGASPTLTSDAKYTVSVQALDKWSQGRLQLQENVDGSIEATFSYEGTTCSNLGRPLEFVYHIKLGSAERGYRVEHAECVPSPTNDGHKYMCEYLDKGESFVKTIAEERPLLGKRLDDVLAWKRHFHPSGCFCEETSRRHKWGLVFEVLHYAMVQRDREAHMEFRQCGNQSQQ